MEEISGPKVSGRLRRRRRRRWWWWWRQQQQRRHHHQSRSVRPAYKRPVWAIISERRETRGYVAAPLRRNRSRTSASIEPTVEVKGGKQKNPNIFLYAAGGYSRHRRGKKEKEKKKKKKKKKKKHILISSYINVPIAQSRRVICSDFQERHRPFLLSKKCI